MIGESSAGAYGLPPAALPWRSSAHETAACLEIGRGSWPGCFFVFLVAIVPTVRAKLGLL